MVEALRWRVGAVLPLHLKEKLSSAEVDHFHAYCDALAAHMDALDLDLASDLQPPRDDVIHCLALRACGRLVTQVGAVDVGERTMHQLRRSIAEPLIRAGWMKEMPKNMDS
jgi:hypothetical protein